MVGLGYEGGLGRTRAERRRAARRRELDALNAIRASVTKQVEAGKKKVRELPPPKVGEIRILAQTPTLKVLQLPAGFFTFYNQSGSGWMLWNRWAQWRHWIIDHDYRRAQRHRMGFLAEADALVKGGTMVSAEEAARAHYQAFKSFQKKQARKKGLKRLQHQTTKLLHEKGGILVSVAAKFAYLIPYVGIVVGPALEVAGGALTVAQKARMAAKIAEKRERELQAAQDRYVNGEIDDAQYEALVETIMTDEARAIRAEKARLDEIARKKSEEEARARMEVTIIKPEEPKPEPPKPPGPRVFTGGTGRSIWKVDLDKDSNERLMNIYKAGGGGYFRLSHVTLGLIGKELVRRGLTLPEKGAEESQPTRAEMPTLPTAPPPSPMRPPPSPDWLPWEEAPPYAQKNLPMTAKPKKVADPGKKWAPFYQVGKSRWVWLEVGIPKKFTEDQKIQILENVLADPKVQAEVRKEAIKEKDIQELDIHLRERKIELSLWQRIVLWWKERKK
jgi:hypothetical protein